MKTIAEQFIYQKCLFVLLILNLERKQVVFEIKSNEADILILLTKI